MFRPGALAASVAFVGGIRLQLYCLVSLINHPRQTDKHFIKMLERLQNDLFFTQQKGSRTRIDEAPLRGGGGRGCLSLGGSRGWRSSPHL